MLKDKSYYQSFLTMLSGNTISQVIPFLIAPILTRLYSPGDFAIFASFIAIVSMIGIISAGRLELAIPIARGDSEARNIVFTGMVFAILLSLISFVFPLFANFFGEMFNSPVLANYLVLVPLAVFSYGLLGIVNNWVLRKQNYGALSGGKIAQSLFNNGVAALLGFIGWGVSGLILGWLIGQVIGVLVPMIFVSRKLSYKGYNITTIKNTVKEYKDFPLINSLHAFTDIFATQFILFWLIAAYFGVIELGLFAIMHKYVRAPIVLITSSVSSVFYVKMGEALNNSENTTPILKKTIVTSVLFSIPFVLVLLFFAPQLFAWYFGEEWEVAGQYAQRILPMLLFLFILSPISSIPILYNQQRKAFLFSSLGYVFTLGSLYISTTLGLEFIDALTIYSIAFAVYQVSYLYWLFLLIKKKHVSTR
jgi:O-antigen/teichoic acid export membrane protein